MAEDDLSAARPSQDDAYTIGELFVAAIQGGVLAEVERLIAADPALVNRRFTVADMETTALHLAATEGRTELARALLDAGAEVGARDQSDNATPLHWAAENGHLEIVRMLVEAGANVAAKDDAHERGPLGWATCMHELRSNVAMYLLAHGAVHDIFSAIAMTDLDTIRQLVAADRSVLAAKMSRYDGLADPMEFALQKQSRWPAVAILFDLGLGSHDPIDCELQMAIFANDRPYVRGLLANRPDLTATTRFPLLARTADPETLKLLLDLGIPVDQTETLGGSTRLHAMAWEGNLPAAKLLLGYGANLDAEDAVYHATPYGWADHNRQVEMRHFLALSKILQTSGLDLKSVTHDGTPLLDLIERKDFAGIAHHAAETRTTLSPHAMSAHGIAVESGSPDAARPLDGSES